MNRVVTSARPSFGSRLSNDVSGVGLQRSDPAQLTKGWSPRSFQNIEWRVLRIERGQCRSDWRFVKGGQ